MRAMYLPFMDHLLQEIDKCLLVAQYRYVVQHITPRQMVNLPFSTAPTELSFSVMRSPKNFLFHDDDFMNLNFMNVHNTKRLYA